MQSCNGNPPEICETFIIFLLKITLVIEFLFWKFFFRYYVKAISPKKNSAIVELQLSWDHFFVESNKI